MPSFKNVILSRGRAKTITTHRLISDALLFVPESQVDAYEHIGLEIMPVPDELKGISAVRNFILGAIQEEAVVMYDDDIKRCVALTMSGQSYLTPDETQDMVRITAQCAKDAGARLFGWNQAWDTRKYQPNSPFRLSTWVGAAVGVIGRETKWDEKLICKCDINTSLNELMERRIIWTDQRFSFVQERDKNLGGNSLFRTAERVQKEVDFLRNRWGEYISVLKTKTTERIKIKVPRQQTVLD